MINTRANLRIPDRVFPHFSKAGGAAVGCGRARRVNIGPGAGFSQDRRRSHATGGSGRFCLHPAAPAAGNVFLRGQR